MSEHDGMSQEMTLRGLLHKLTAEHLDLDAPITCGLYERTTDGGAEWVDMVIVGVISRIGPDGQPVQELDLVRRGQVEEPSAAPDGRRSNGWECSHVGEPCRCDEMLICICAACTRKRWPNEDDDA